jgi:hypothetical protein
MEVLSNNLNLKSFAEETDSDFSQDMLLVKSRTGLWAWSQVPCCHLLVRTDPCQANGDRAL